MNVARLAKATDRSIGDVIRRIPGMRMEGGLLKYQGKPLKQINIEGIDLTQGGYELITSNIDASDISTIQVLDNYQGIKALVGKRSSDDVILNLKLSPKKRGIWGVSLDLGLGYGDGLETNSRIRSNYLPGERSSSAWRMSITQAGSTTRAPLACRGVARGRSTSLPA